ncbi:hypothetical protein N9W92_07315 [Planktomarina temperata]|nr:hypothetical protein [Planktomarina temperata]
MIEKQVQRKNIFVRSSARAKIALSASPLGFLLAACGGGGGDGAGTTSISTTTSNNFVDNLNGLNAFVAESASDFTGRYSASDQLASPALDQSKSENYLSGYDNKTVKMRSIVCFSPAIKIPLKLNIGKEQKLKIKSLSAFSILIYYYWMRLPMLVGAVVGFITMGFTSLAIPKKTQSEQHFLSLKKQST